MKTTVLYYFSGSGNTYYIAKKVKKRFEYYGYQCDLKNIEKINSVEINNKDYIGLLFPVAIQSTFPIVWDFINDLPRTKGQKIFMIDTMQAFSGGVVGPVKRVLESKGYNCVGALEVKMNSSMQTKKIPKEKQHIKNIKAINKAESFVEDLLEGKTKWNRIPIISDWMRNISSNRKIWTKVSEGIKIDYKKCINCKKCLKNCPVNAIDTMENKVAINHNICISCMRCINQCPKNAFTLKGKMVYQNKY